MKKKRDKTRATVGPFENWLTRHLPKCVFSKNKDCSTMGLGKKQRNFVLQQYGYASYNDYLKSELWQSIRSQVLENAICVCGCGKVANQVHHRAYSEANLLGKTFRGLTPINRDCHFNIEFDEDRKCSLGEANQKLKSVQVEHVEQNKFVTQGVPTEEEIKAFLSGAHKKLGEQRKQVVRIYLKTQSLKKKLAKDKAE